MLKKVSQTNLSAASPAVLHVKMQEAVPPTAEAVKCSMQHAQNAEKSARFLLNLATIARFTAAIALQTEDNYKISDFGAPFGAHFFYFLNKMLVNK